jgi:hypothetical protein
METNYKWIINLMQCKEQDGDLQNVVIKVNWIREASATKNDIEYKITMPGTQEFTQVDSSNFTPYDQLTYEQVCGWLDGSIDVTMIDNSLNNQLDLIVNPPLISLPVPWDATI